MTTTLNVGDAVLYTKSYGARPRAGIVIKVTKAQARVALADEDGTMRNPAAKVGPFKREAFNGQHEVIKSGSYRTYSAVWAKTPEREVELNETADKVEKHLAEKKAEQKANQEARDKRLADELAEVRQAMNAPTPGSLPICRTRDMMPDGSRIYTVDIPVKPCHAERKKGWERVIVRCWNEKSFNWKAAREEDAEIQVVRSAFTFANGGSSSFSSCSFVYSNALDEEAVWDAVRSCYHSGW